MGQLPKAIESPDRAFFVLHDEPGQFATVTQLRVGGLVIANTSLFITRAEQLGALTLRKAVPTIFQSREFAAAKSRWNLFAWASLDSSSVCNNSSSRQP
jgi:hypothetical protein